MQPYDWVTKIAVLQTKDNLKPVESSRLSVIDSKTTWHSRNFGQGFEQQPEDGGYHEVAARNHSLDLARESGCNWALICDADEFFLPDAYHHIYEAHRLKKDVVWFSCYHYCSPNQYLWWNNQVRHVQGSSHLMHDAHARAIRLGGRKWKYVMNNNQKYRDTMTNRTEHCHLMGHPAGCCHHGYGKIHIHTRHMFEPKRPTQEWLSKREQRESDIVLPQAVVDDWLEQEGVLPTNVGGI